MKKILLTLLVIACTTLSAQVTITMEQEAGVYKVPCVVNGAKMKFIFDTGAATVCLSESMAEYLLDNDYISKEDFIGTGTSTVADGRTVNHKVIILRDIEIAGLHLKDVEASVVEGQRAPLLLGQTAIQQLGKYAIKDNLLYIYAGQSDTRMRERRRIYDKLISWNYDLCNFEKFCDALDSDGGVQRWVYKELVFIDTYLHIERHKKWFSILYKFSEAIEKEHLSDAQLYELFPEFKNNEEMLVAAFQFKNTVDNKNYDIHTLMGKFPEFFRIDGWWSEEEDQNILSLTSLVDEKAEDYKDYIDFFQKVCGTNQYDMEKLVSYHHTFETSKSARDNPRAIANLLNYYNLLWSYQEPVVSDYYHIGCAAYRISYIEEYKYGLEIAVENLENVMKYSNSRQNRIVYDFLGDAYFLLGQYNYALSTWEKWLNINGVNYDDLQAIRELYGAISLTPYKIFLCMQGSDVHYWTAWKRNFLTYDIIIQLRQKFNEDAYILLDEGKISAEDAVLKTTVRTEELGERIYFLDQLYYEDNGKHNRDLLEKATLCGNKYAFDILRGM